MISELQPVWKQLAETYQALRVSLAQVPDGRLTWKPGGKATSVADIVQHLASSNCNYASIMEQQEWERTWTYRERPDWTWLMERLDESETYVRAAFERFPAEAIHAKRADEWWPLNPDAPVEGPLDALWFAMQMVRHSAYHLGQINLYLLLLEEDD